MRTLLASVVLTVVVVVVMAAQGRSKAVDPSWTARFDLEQGELASTGRNPYFVLEPGYSSILEDGRDRLVVSVLNETRRIDGVDTRVVEERETHNGEIVEVSRNYFAISSRTNSVFYFGEDVDAYKGGKVVNHEGSWLAGTNGARFGLMMPGVPLMRAKYYQEIAPGVAMDRGEIVSMTDALVTRAGNFKDVMKVEETTPLESGREYKYFARGVGLLQDGSLKLVTYGPAVQGKGD